MTEREAPSSPGMKADPPADCPLPRWKNICKFLSLADAIHTRVCKLHLLLTPHTVLPSTTFPRNVKARLSSLIGVLLQHLIACFTSVPGLCSQLSPNHSHIFFSCLGGKQQSWDAGIDGINSNKEHSTSPLLDVTH